MGFAETAYNGIASLGRAKAYIGFFIAFLIFCLTSYFGYYLYNSEDIYGKNFIKGKVKDSLCKKIQNYKNYDCSLNIQYNIDTKEYESNNYLLPNSTKYYSQGNEIDLRYNTKDKNDITNDTWPNSSKGIGIMIFGLIILIFASIQLYIMITFEIAAVASGTADITSTIVSSISSGFGFNRRKMNY